MLSTGLLMAWLVAAPVLSLERTASLTSAAPPERDGVTALATAAPQPNRDAAQHDDALGVEVEAYPEGAATDADALAASSRPLYAEAQRELALARHTAYAHATGVDEAIGRFVFDCSGFVGYALSQAVPEAFAQLQAVSGPRPTSRDFVRFVQALEPGQVRGRWRRLASVAELQPGDVVAWLRPRGQRGRAGGHVMIVGAAPYEYPEGSGEYVLRIIDSSGSRRAPLGNVTPARRMTGLGVGRVVLRTGPGGAPLAFGWSSGGRARLYRSTIALARVE
jgi:cell wall-associated NlpC family hydrolase